MHLRRQGRARGNFGYSFYFNEPVTRSHPAKRLPATLLLVLTSLVLSSGIGAGHRHPHGAQRPKSVLSSGDLASTLAIAGYSAPVFWTGLMLLVLFASVWPVLPVSGMAEVAVHPATAWRSSLDVGAPPHPARR